MNTRKPTQHHLPLAALCLLTCTPWLHAGKPQTIHWTAPATNAVIRLLEPVTLEATASSGLPVSFRVERGPAIIAGPFIIATDVGTIRLVAEQPGDAEFDPAPPIRRIVNQSSVTLDLVGQWTNQPGNGVVSIQIEDDRAYAFRSVRYLDILDLSDPIHPCSVATYTNFPRVVNAHVVGTRAYVACDSMGFQIIDVSDPTDLCMAGSYRSTQPQVRFLDVHAAGDLAYACDGLNLGVYSLRHPSQPVKVGGCPLPSASRLVLQGTTAYACSGQGGLQVVSLDNATNPVVVARARTPSAGDVRVLGHLAYVADFISGLVILDFTERTNAVPVGVCGKITPTRVDVSGGYAFLIDPNRGLCVVDVSDLRNPLLVGVYSEHFNTLQAVGSLVYAAQGSLGIKVLKLREGIAQTINFPVPNTTTLASAPLTLTAQANSGLPVTFSVAAGPATIDGNQLTATNFGTVLIRASQAGNAQFLPASVDRMITVVEHAPEFIGESFVYQDNLPQFRLGVRAPLGGRLTVLYSDDLTSWYELQVGTFPGGEGVIADTGCPPTRRFYKLQVR